MGTHPPWCGADIAAFGDGADGRPEFVVAPVGCVSTDLGLRLPVRLRYDCAGVTERGGGVDVHSAHGFPECLWRAVGPGRGPVPAGTRRGSGTCGAALPARDDGPGDDVCGERRMADRARRPVHGALPYHL